MIGIYLRTDLSGYDGNEIVQEEEAQPLLQAATGSIGGMAPALVQLFESRMKAGITRRAGSNAKQTQDAAAASQPEASEAAAAEATAAACAGPAQVRMAASQWAQWQRWLDVDDFASMVIFQGHANLVSLELCFAQECKHPAQHGA